MLKFLGHSEILLVNYPMNATIVNGRNVSATELEMGLQVVMVQGSRHMLPQNI